MTITDERLRQFIENCNASASLRRNRGEEDSARRSEFKAEIASELLERRAADRWIPVKERLPGINAKVLVFNGYRGVCIYKAVHIGYAWSDLYGNEWTRITHWKPLPEPPRE